MFAKELFWETSQNSRENISVLSLFFNKDNCNVVIKILRRNDNFPVNFSKFSGKVFYRTPTRSSHQKCSARKGILRNFVKFTGKHLSQSVFFNKVAGLMPASLLKKSLRHSCSPVNFAKFLRTPFLQNTSGRLLLTCVSVVLIGNNH